jgi:hypothetical protein
MLNWHALDTQLRCKRCGSRLPDGQEPVQCLKCHTNLAQTGVYSELLAWAKTRELGRISYIWLRWVLGWGGLLALGFSLGCYLRGETSPALYFALWLASLLAGYCAGSLYWRAAEREYQDGVKQDVMRRL